MKSPAARLKTKRVFVLGAGVSFAATQGSPKTYQVAPLDRDFCGRLVSLKKTKLSWAKQASKRLIKNWKDHRSFESLGLEEAIITQLGYAQFIEEIYKRRRIQYGDVQFIRDITHLISFELDRAKENYTDIYKKLVSNLLPNNKWDQSICDRVLTFNYDTLIDQHLINAGVPPEELYFDKISCDSGLTQKRRKKKYPNPFLIKLHGSINWLCKQKDFEKILKPDGSKEAKILDIIWLKNRDAEVPTTQDETAPCLLPPLPSKPITSVSIFNWLWTKAAEYLSEAQELVIAGYSLPVADSLAWSLFGAITNKKLQKITVIDPDPLIWRKWKTLLARQNLGSKPRWNFYSDMFEFFDDLQKPPSE